MSLTEAWDEMQRARQAWQNASVYNCLVEVVEPLGEEMDRAEAVFDGMFAALMAA